APAARRAGPARDLPRAPAAAAAAPAAAGALPVTHRSAPMVSQNCLSVHKAAPKFSFSHSGLGPERTKPSPSPGTYNVVGVDRDKFSRSASYSILGASKMGGAATVGSAAKVPGPGAYVPNDVRSLSPPKWAFGSEPRMAEKKAMKSAGPGQYNTATQNDAVLEDRRRARGVRENGEGLLRGLGSPLAI
ncbi:unnamed protein product, partial [Prorocentrum cordatum]